jgi:hypothetical protein
MLEIVSLALWANTAANFISDCQYLNPRFNPDRSALTIDIESKSKQQMLGKYINPKETIYLSDRNRDEETKRLEDRVFGSERDRNRNRNRNRDERRTPLEKRVFGSERDRDRDRDRNRDRNQEIERFRNIIRDSDRDS